MLTIPNNERSTANGYGGTLMKDGDVPLTFAEIASWTLTVYKRGAGGEASDTVIREAVDLKGATNGDNGMVIHATTGAFVLSFESGDMEIFAGGASYEWHIGLFQLATIDGVTLNWEVKLRIKNLRRVS
jgi:hypothetical protein